MNRLFKNPFARMQKVAVVALCVVLAGSFSCKTLNTSEEVFEPVVPDDEVIAFFEEYLPVVSYSYPLSECFFFNKEDREDKCVMINSVDEFRKSFSCHSNLLPVIDFDSYTLIIGQHQVSNLCDYVVEQEIVAKQEKHILNLRWSCRGDGSYPSFNTLYYWGIYLKIPIKSISVNIINQ